MKLPNFETAAVFALFFTAPGTTERVVDNEGLDTWVIGLEGVVALEGGVGLDGVVGLETGFTGRGFTLGFTGGAAAFRRKEGTGGTVAFPESTFIAFPATAAFAAVFNAPLFPVTALIRAAAFIFVG